MKYVPMFGEKWSDGIQCLFTFLSGYSFVIITTYIYKQIVCMLPGNFLLTKKKHLQEQASTIASIIIKKA